MGAIFIRRSSSIASLIPSRSWKFDFLKRVFSKRNRNEVVTNNHLNVEKRLMSGSHDKNSCYAPVLKAYLEEMLRLGWPLEVYIEGGRSRTGKPIADPKIGILSTIVDSLDNNQLKDFFVVPVSITYDKVMDLSGFHKEWLGKSKTNETIWSAVSGILKQFKRHRYGGVRMNFGQPFSAKETLRALNLKDTPDFKSIDVTQQEFLPPTLKKVIEKLATLSVYKSQEISSIMSTHLVAFLLLNKFRTGTSIDKFTSAFQYMTEKINGGVVYPNLSLGFQSTPEQALKSF